LGADLPVDQPVNHLSPGQQTLISIARAFAWSTRRGGAAVMVMDEPTAALTDQEITQLFQAVTTLRSHGTTVIYVSHRLHEIFSLTDRVTVMRNGRVITTQPTAELDQPTLVRLMTGREPNSPTTVRPVTQPSTTTPLLRVQGLTGPGVKSATFSLQRGEILGIAGLVGAGRSELLRLLYGATQRTAGTVQLADEFINLRSPSAALRQGIAFVPEERRSQGLLLHRPIVENMTLARLRSFALGGLLLQRRRELTAADQQQRALALKASSLHQPVAQLSGGNQQKVLFARTLIGKAADQLRLLLLDEPTRGVDVGVKEEIYQIIRTQAARGVGVIVVSSELPELLALTDRILVLHEGRQVALVETAAVDQETVLRYCYGIERSRD
jgi:ABC-type sugar transport system ATPase subunit